MALVLLHVGDDEPEIRRHQPLGRGLVAGECPPGQTLLFLGIRDHRELLDVEEILIEGAGRGGTDQHTSFRTDVGHRQTPSESLDRQRCGRMGGRLGRGERQRI